MVDEDKAAKRRELREVMAHVGVHYDEGTDVLDLSFEDWMRFHLSHMWAELRDDGSAQNQAVMYSKEKGVTLVNLHFLPPSDIPKAMLALMLEHKPDRVVVMCEVWAADDNRTPAEREAGVKIRQPREREDRTEALVSWGWQRGVEGVVSLKWEIDRLPDGKPVMRGKPERAEKTGGGPLRQVAEIMYTLYQAERKQ